MNASFLSMVPGPVTVPEAIRAVYAESYGSADLESDFIELYTRAQRQFKSLLNTRNDIVFMTGEGMLALWGALKSCLAPGDTVLAVGTGVFGDGIGDMAASFGCRVERLSLPYDTTIGNADSLERVEAAIRRVRPRMLTAVHCETPSGTLNPLAELGTMKERLGVPLFYVDAVASAGGVPVLADQWHVDLLLTGSQKCLSAPPSMSILAVSDAAWAAMEEVNYQGYDAVLPFKNVQAEGRCPYTPYWHGVAALEAAADAILAEGMDAVFARHEAVARQCRHGLEKLGVALFPSSDAVQSPTVTAARVPRGFTWEDWQTALRKRGLIVGGSFGPMAGTVFRLGHMGVQADEALMGRALEVIAEALS